MKLIACVDNSMGMAFGGRRQSRDGALIGDMLKNFGESLAADISSSHLFPQESGVCFADLVSYEAGESEYVFTEKYPPSYFFQRRDIAEIVLYRWNRDYPSDMFFDIPLDAWKLADTFEFQGTSHDKITRERYVK